MDTVSFSQGFVLGVGSTFLLLLLVRAGLWLFFRYYPKKQSFESSNPSLDYNAESRDQDVPRPYKNGEPGVVSPNLVLSTAEDMEPSQFQEEWEKIVDFRREDFCISSDKELTHLLSNRRIFCIASGQVEVVTKYYFYARQARGRGIFLMEVIVDIETKESSLTIKSNMIDQLAGFIDYYYNSIGTIIKHSV